MGVSVEIEEERRITTRRILERVQAGRRKTDRERHDVLEDNEGELQGAIKFSTHYVLMLAAVFIIGLTAINSANSFLAPLLHDEKQIDKVAKILADGRSYLTYDLNIETRRLRHEHIRNLDHRPRVAVMGASHWQEGHSDIGGPVKFYNAHVHRDYYEDILAVAGVFARYNKLPDRMVITIRDNQFTPVDDRTDFLWVPTLADYRYMAARLGLASHLAYASGITPQLRQKLSLPLLQANVERYLQAGTKPQASTLMEHPTLDTLRPDGSIQWSYLHNEAFTQERARREALEFAAHKRNNPPMVDPFGLKSVDTLIAFLVKEGVDVQLAHPPFNPIYWDAVQGSPYAEGLKRIEKIAQDLADKYGLKIVGGFNPYKVGCTKEMYIDAEHSRPECLANIARQFMKNLPPVRNDQG